MAHAQPQHPQGQIRLGPKPRPVLLPFRLGGGAIPRQGRFPGAGEGLSRPGALIKSGEPAPERILVQADFFLPRAAEHHRSQPAVAKRQRLVPVLGLLAIPQHVRSVVISVHASFSLSQKRILFCLPAIADIITAACSNPAGGIRRISFCKPGKTPCNPEIRRPWPPPWAFAPRPAAAAPAKAASP